MIRKALYALTKLWRMGDGARSSERPSLEALSSLRLEYFDVIIKLEHQIPNDNNRLSKHSYINSTLATAKYRAFLTALQTNWTINHIYDAGNGQLLIYAIKS